MAGHCKFCITLLGGYYVFHDPIAPNQLLGICSTLTGIALYSFFRLTDSTEKEQPKKPLQRV